MERHQGNPSITVKRNFLTDWIIPLKLCSSHLPIVLSCSQILAEINTFYWIVTVDKYQSSRVTNYNKRIHSFCANKRFFLNAKSKLVLLCQLLITQTDRQKTPHSLILLSSGFLKSKTGLKQL